MNGIVTIVCLGVSVFLLVVVYGNLTRVNSQKNKLEELNLVKEQLEVEKAKLNDEVQKLNDPDYVARYARDHYIFPSEGEEVIKLPEINKE